MMARFLCLFGFHHWWHFSDRRVCSRCGRLMVPETATNNPREVK